MTPSGSFVSVLLPHLAFHWRLLALLATVLLPLAASAEATLSPDNELDTTRQALRTLLHVVNTQTRADPLQDLQERFAADDVTAFTLSDDGMIPLTLEMSPRPVSIPATEWAALAPFRHYGGDTPYPDWVSEDDSRSFVLVDLDEDGYRDLIVALPNRGSQAGTTWQVYRREPEGAFVMPPADNDSDFGYYAEGKGRDDDYSLVRIDGRHYLLYRDSTLDEDWLTLYRPLSGKADIGEAVRLRFHHRLDIAPPAKDTADFNDGARLEAKDPELRPALAQQLQRMSRDPQHHEEPKTRCPTPADTPADYADLWPWNSAGAPGDDHFDAFALTTSRACYSVTLVAAIGPGARYAGPPYGGYAWIFSRPVDGDEDKIPLRIEREFIDAEIVAWHEKLP